VGAPDGPWRRWAAAAAVEDDPFSLLRWFCHLMKFQWISIDGSERGVKKRKIGLYGT